MLCELGVEGYLLACVFSHLYFHLFVHQILNIFLMLEAVFRNDYSDNLLNGESRLSLVVLKQMPLLSFQ